MSEHIRNIVVGVDRSATARAAAEVAAGLARVHGARLHVVTALTSVRTKAVHGPGGDEFFIDDAEEARLHLTELADSWPDLETTVTVGTGKPGDVLVEEADRLGADLIVVGNRRVQSIARVLGTVAYDVARRASCDVYIANTTAEA